MATRSEVPATLMYPSGESTPWEDPTGLNPDLRCVSVERATRSDLDAAIKYEHEQGWRLRALRALRRQLGARLRGAVTVGDLVPLGLRHFQGDPDLQVISDGE